MIYLEILINTTKNGVKWFGGASDDPISQTISCGICVVKVNACLGAMKDQVIEGPGDQSGPSLHECLVIDTNLSFGPGYFKYNCNILSYPVKGFKKLLRSSSTSGLLVLSAGRAERHLTSVFFLLCENTWLEMFKKGESELAVLRS